MDTTEHAQAFIEELKQIWVPQIKKEIGYDYYGYQRRKKVEFTLYFDVYLHEWTTKRRAFKGFVFQNIDKLIK